MSEVRGQRSEVGRQMTENMEVGRKIGEFGRVNGE
jgi:hypothetical protein